MFGERRIWFLGIVALAAVTLVSFACSNDGGDGEATQAPTNTDVPTAASEATVAPSGTATPLAAASATNTLVAGLTIEALRNATYASEFAENGTFTLVDGLFKDTITSNGFESPLGVRFGDKVGMGDLDGDGVGDAAVTLITDTGGTGSFVNLVAVLNEDGAPAPIASVFLGDRVAVEAIRIAESRIELDMIVRAPSDPFCCPSLPVLRTYALEDSNLILIEELPR